MPEKKPKLPKQKMIKTSIDLTAEHYHFLKVKALDRKMKGQDPSFVTILRELIEEDRKKWNKLAAILIFVLCLTPLAHATYVPFNTSSSGNIGIGSSAPGQKLDVQGTVRATNFIGSGAGLTGVGSNYWTLATSGNIGISTVQNVGIGTTFVGGAGEGALSVMNGNVGIGTWVPANALSVNGSINVLGNISNSYLNSTGGNVGIGSSNPGQKLDVQGVVRMTGFNLSTTPTNGYVLTSDVNGNGTWQAASGANYWTLQTSGNIGISTVQNVGIGTTFVGGTGEAALSVMNGNVGIGTWVPGVMLDVNGTVRGTAFSLGGSTITSWPSGGASNWTYTSSGNIGLSTAAAVGIGTTFIGGTGEAALSVMNGNVGIGTWVPGDSLDIVGGNIGIGTAYNLVGIGTSTLLTLRTDKTSIYLGLQSGENTTAGNQYSTALGYQALYSLTAQNGGNNGYSGNLAVGYQALYKETTGYSNVAVGNSAMNATTSGNANVAVGALALGNQATTEQQDTIMGYSAGEDMQGSYNTAVGSGALYGVYNQNTGNNNSAMGYNAMNQVTSGQNNVALGYQAGYPRAANGTQAGSYNTWLGANSGPSGTSDVSNSVGIGSYATAGASNVMVLGGMGTYALNVGIGTDMNGAATTASTSSLVVMGNVGLGTIQTGTSALSVMNGNVGIGTWVPSNAVSVNGSINTLGNTGNTYLNSTGGNVGIGTTVPPQVLYVIGKIQATSGFIAASNVGITSTCPNGKVNGVVDGIITSCY